MPFGAEISHFGKATDSEIFHLERETMLVNDFGSIISALLMGDPKSGRKSSAKRRRNRDRRGGDLDDIDVYNMYAKQMEVPLMKHPEGKKDWDAPTKLKIKNLKI